MYKSVPAACRNCPALSRESYAVHQETGSKIEVSPDGVNISTIVGSVTQRHNIHLFQSFGDELGKDLLAYMEDCVNPKRIGLVRSLKRLLDMAVDADIRHIVGIPPKHDCPAVQQLSSVAIRNAADQTLMDMDD